MSIPLLIFALAFSIGSQSATAQSDLIDGQVMKVDQSPARSHQAWPTKRLGMESGMTMSTSTGSRHAQGVKAGINQVDAEQ